MVTEETFATWTALKAAHIFPRTHVNEVSLNYRMVPDLCSLPLQWLRKQYHHLITDTALASAVGGHSKIDSVQNVFMLRSDLCDMWDNYEFSVNPDVILGCLVYSLILIHKPLGQLLYHRIH